MEAPHHSSLPPVFVLGMSRSGTSIVSALLQAGGLWQGRPDEMVPAMKHNPLGFYEYKPMTDLNERLLQYLGGSPAPPRLTAGWERDAALEPFYQEARALLQHLGQGGRWSSKDPRLSLLLPFWKTLLPQRRFVVCVRHPLAVTDSLNHYFQIPRARGLDLWTTYSLAACAGTQAEERLFISYDSLMRDPQAQGRRLFEFCGLNLEKLDAALTRIQPSMQHHQHSFEELEASGSSSDAAATYRWMLSQAGQPVPDIAWLPQPSQKFSYTGERYVPGVSGEAELEHLHRYMLARSLAQGKDVCDIASGEGYGSELLSQVALSVAGVDIDPLSVAHAQSRYPRPNLSFRQGSCSSIPLPTASVDLVVSFETLEHHDRHSEMMLEIRRILRPRGLLLISSPDKSNYSDKPGIHNPFHVKELYRNEFEALLRAHFFQHRLYAQRSFFSSMIQPESGQSPWLNFQKKSGHIATSPQLPEPSIWLALASDGPLPTLEAGVFEGPLKETELFKKVFLDQSENLKVYFKPMAWLRSTLAWRLLKNFFKV